MYRLRLNIGKAVRPVIKPAVLALMFLVVHICKAQIDGAQDMRVATELKMSLDTLQGPERIEALNRIAFIYAIDSGEACLKYAEQARDLALTANDRKGLAQSFYNLGLYEHYHGTSVMAIRHYDSALTIFREYDMYEKQGDVNTALVLAFFASRQLSQALDIISKEVALECYRKAGNMHKEAVILYGSGFFHNNYTKEYRKSIELHLEALRICDQFKSSSLLRGGINAATGYSYSLQGIADSAFYYYFRAMRVLDSTIISDRLMKIQVARELGSIYRTFGNNDSAIHYITGSIRESEKYGYEFGIIAGNMILADILREKGGISLPIKYLEEAKRSALYITRTGNYFDSPEKKNYLGFAWDIAFRMSDMDRIITAKTRLETIYEKLAELYLKSGKEKEALEHYLQLEELKDSLFRHIQSREMAELLAQYENDRKEEEIVEMTELMGIADLKLRQTERAAIGLTGGVILMIIIVVLLFIQGKIRSEQKGRALEQQLLLNQMNPHFMFNALASIQSYLFSHEKARASHYLEVFSSLIRDILQHSRKEIVSLKSDLTVIENYLSLQKMRYVDKLTYSISMEQGLDHENIFLPPMLIQPFVENAVEHGIKLKDGKGKLEVKLSQENGWLLCYIEDDGVGRQRSVEMQRKRRKRRPGLAIRISKERLKTISRKTKRAGSIVIEDLNSEQRDTGTKVTLRIPLPGNAR